MMQSAVVPSGRSLDVSTSTGPPPPVRARTKTRLLDKTRIRASIDANANLGIFIAVLPLCHQFIRILCSFSQERAFIVTGGSTLAPSLNSTQLAEQPFKR